MEKYDDESDTTVRSQEPYLKDKSTDVTGSTLSNYKTTLNVFCDWYLEQGVENLNTLTREEIQRFKERDQVKTITLKTDMTCIKDFIRFCEHVNAVPKDLHMMVRIPTPTKRKMSPATFSVGKKQHRSSTTWRNTSMPPFDTSS